MIYDYQNCIDFAVEQAVEKAVKKAAKENLAKGLAEGEAKGRAEGLAEGEAKGEKLAKLETARNLLKENAPIDMICRVTSLSEKDIENLLRS
mgnify:CR=1 FL=1